MMENIDLNHKIIKYKRLSLHKLMKIKLYGLLDSFVKERDSNEYENFVNKVFKPLDMNVYDFNFLKEYITDSVSYIYDLISQVSYRELLVSYQLHRVLNNLANKNDVYTDEIVYVFLREFIVSETHRIFIHLLDSPDEKELDELRRELGTFKTFENPIIKIFFTKLYDLLYCFIFNENSEEDIGSIIFAMDSSKIKIANDNLIRIFEEKDIFKHINTDTNLFKFFYSNSKDFLKKIPLTDDDSAYEKVKLGLDDFFIMKYNTKSPNVAKLKEFLLSDNIFYPKTTADYDEQNINMNSNYTYHSFLSSILHYVISDDMIRYKHSYDLRRTENKKTFLRNTNINSKKDLYFTKQYYDLVLKYAKDFKRRESLFLIHLCFFMSISPDDALQIANVLGFYKHKNRNEALKTFNEDIVIFYPNFKLLKATTFFV